MADTWRVLVTGSREWNAEGTLRMALTDAVADRPAGTEPVIVHGACPRGADAMADTWARDYGYRSERHPADWAAPCRPECKPGHRRRGKDGSTYCPAAGNYRNQEMVDTAPDACVAFFKTDAASSGTSDCVRRAEAAGIRVRRITG